MELYGSEDNPVPVDYEVFGLSRDDGAVIRCAIFYPKTSKARATVVVLHGRAEAIEKYFETIGELQDRGFVVATFDWRGQGLSSIGGGGYFKRSTGDLSAFVAKLNDLRCPTPIYAIAHSMGGSILLNSLIERIDAFERAVLCAPMIALPMPGFCQRLAGSMACAAGLLGCGGGHIPPAHKFAGNINCFANNPLTSCRKRYERNRKIGQILPVHSDLRVTFSWLCSACRTMARLSVLKDHGSKTTALLIFGAALDKVVKSAASEQFFASIPNATFINIIGARHELLQERDVFRDQLWAAIDQFLA